MIAKRFLAGFFLDEDGAVTVDWVMLTSAIVLLGILVINVIQSSLFETATGIGDVIESSTNVIP